MKTQENRVTNLVANAACVFFSFCAIAPVVLLIIASFTDNDLATAQGFSFFPKQLSLEAYEYIAIQWQTIGRAYLMTVLVTVMGTAISLIISILFAYGIQQRDIPGMRVFSFLLIFTMLFNGGLVSTYYCYIKLFHIKNTIWALVVPNLLMSAFDVILIRNYYTTSIPDALLEAARLDRAGEFRILFSIVLPLSKPIIATIGLMRALIYWNDWTNGLYYLSERGGKQLYTIQCIMNNINENLEILRQSTAQGVAAGLNVMSMPSTTVRMAIAVIGILPILVAYPFFQKYFVKGI